MTPMHFVGQSRVLEAPPGYDHEANGECGGLPVMFTNGGCASVWKPSPEELAQLNAGGGIVIWLMGGQPVMSVGACAKESLLVEA